MEVFNSSSRNRETYHIAVQSSLLWETALGIAAITNTALRDTLEKPMNEWEAIRKSMSQGMKQHLDTVQQHNTWKALLELLHQSHLLTLADFTHYIQQLTEEDLKFNCLPFMGKKKTGARMAAARGDLAAVKDLQELTAGHAFLTDYIEYIATADPAWLKKHLIEVMTGWYEQVIAPEADHLEAILSRDHQSKAVAKEKMHPEELVSWATGGIEYTPEPSVSRVLLIPHLTYRPWNVEADLEDTKVFYYPVANESMNPEDPYMPDQFLVQKCKALGDENRLRILKILGEKERTLKELTTLLSMRKSTVHHHVKQLKAARFVKQNGAIYQVASHQLASLGHELQGYAGGHYE
ncbi:metalloregulator ArsR/SmtB family transcription factor [Halobacillus rhizosphaerae]|uniref:ArsR/SmtB family transcription factor n=1 Tax=Halobacillus rhizosphaerae TaxID=3064889 RepID=UPI00398B9F62